MARPKKNIVPGMAARIKQVREQADHMSQANFGKMIELSDGTISFIESETTEVSKQTIALICDRFMVSREWLETGVGDPYAADEDTRALTRAMFGLSKAKRNLLAVLASMPDEVFEEFETAYIARLKKQME